MRKWQALAVSKFEFADNGAGRFELRGDMSFETAEQILRASEKLFKDQAKIEIDLAGVQRTDSAGLALLLEWTGRAKRADTEISFVAIPDKVRAIAVTAEVEALLGPTYSVSSKK
jgi:phospholipid transport system transporter-binding protein